MIVDDIYLLYENSGKYFSSYDVAYFNGRKPNQDKRVYYVFTPTMQRFKRVCDLERAYRNYFKGVCDCDFYDLINRQGSKQLNLIGEI